MKAIDAIMTARNRMRAKDSGFGNLPAMLALFAREFHDQNTVLGCQRNQHYEPHLRVKVERQARQQGIRPSYSGMLAP